MAGIVTGEWPAVGPLVGHDGLDIHEQHLHSPKATSHDTAGEWATGRVHTGEGVVVALLEVPEPEVPGRPYKPPPEPPEPEVPGLRGQQQGQELR